MLESVHSRGESAGPGRIVSRRMVLGSRVEGYSGEAISSFIYLFHLQS